VEHTFLVRHACFRIRLAFFRTTPSCKDHKVLVLKFFSEGLKEEGKEEKRGQRQVPAHRPRHLGPSGHVITQKKIMV
jgi:hypothetical protein